MRGQRDQLVNVREAAERAAARAAHDVEGLLEVQDPLTRYIGMERYVNFQPLAARHAQIAEAYSPHSGPASFPLPVYWVPWGDAVEVGDAHLSASSCPPEMAPVAVHPCVAEIAPPREPDELLDAVPTSSGRTVLVDSVNSLEFVKLHHPGRLGRFHRSLNLAKWLASLEVWALVCGSGADLSCHVMPEPGGSYLDRVHGRGFGCIRRCDEWLWSRMAGGAQLYPFFSILHRDRDGSPIVVERIAEDTGETPASLCLRIIELLVTSYWELAWGLGLIPEFHTQNCLLLVGPRSDEVALIVRDLTDMRVDVSRREQVGLESTVSCWATIRRDRREQYFAHRSYAYDRNVGELVVKRLISCTAAGDESVERELMANARRLARRAAPPDDDYFQPADRCFAYSDATTSPELIDTGRKPILR